MGGNRFLYWGIKYNIFGLILKTSYVTQTLSIKYRGTIEPRATTYLEIPFFTVVFPDYICEHIIGKNKRLMQYEKENS